MLALLHFIIIYLGLWQSNPKLAVQWRKYSLLNLVYPFGFQSYGTIRKVVLENLLMQLIAIYIFPTIFEYNGFMMPLQLLLSSWTSLMSVTLSFLLKPVHEVQLLVVLLCYNPSSSLFHFSDCTLTIYIFTFSLWDVYALLPCNLIRDSIAYSDEVFFAAFLFLYRKMHHPYERNLEL